DHTLVLLIVGSGLCAAWVQMPLQTAILNRIPSEKINRGTALNNALKQLFGSFGVAMVTTILVNRLTFHQAILAERVTAASPMVHRMMGAAQGMALQHGWTAVQGKQLLLSVLSGQVRQLAAVLSFDDAFLVLTVMALVALVPAAFLGWGAHAQREPAMPA
ncbi:MAG: hypothetical protein KGJ86_15295, partial [Chloroflexota bacterium]|nr:hypothetical protein [Chloroflexota bacterium]